MTRALILSCAAALATPAIGQAPKPVTVAAPQKAIPRAEFLKNVDNRFNSIDTNHDGKISRDELVAAQQRDLQQAKARIAQEIEAKFRQLDTNHDGQLSLQEFMAAAPQIRTSETPDDLMKRYDANHDGKITADEFRAPEIAKFNKIDANHDGIVTPAELQAAQGKK